MTLEFRILLDCIKKLKGFWSNVVQVLLYILFKSACQDLTFNFNFLSGQYI